MLCRGLSHRPPRRGIVLDELQKVTAYTTKVDRCAVMRRRMPKISPGAVQRNWALLAER